MKKRDYTPLKTLLKECGISEKLDGRIKPFASKDIKALYRYFKKKEADITFLEEDDAIAVNDYVLSNDFKIAFSSMPSATSLNFLVVVPMGVSQDDIVVITEAFIDEIDPILKGQSIKVTIIH